MKLEWRSIDGGHQSIVRSPRNVRELYIVTALRTGSWHIKENRKDGWYQVNSGDLQTFSGAKRAAAREMGRILEGRE